VDDKKLSDAEIFKIIEEFNGLSDNDRASRILSTSGGSKDVYNVPGYDYVLKAPKKGHSEAHIKQVEDYLIQKQLSKHLPVEKQILVTQPNDPALLLQKKMKQFENAGDDADWDGIDKQIKDGYKTLKSEAVSKNINPNTLDLDYPNFAFDENNTPKIIDSGKFRFSGDISNWEQMENKNKALRKARETIVEKLASPNGKSRIYRSIPIIGPAIGVGLAAMSGEANAASSLPILNEADSLGPEQGSEDWEIENPQQNPELRRQALQKLR
jgi:hypothetical protein